MDLIKPSLDIINWLVLAIDDTSEGKRVKERYMMTSNDWKAWYRPDCTMETALAFLKMWQYSKNNTYLQLSRDLYDSIVKIRYSDGSFRFSVEGDYTVYTNDNSEIPIFIFRMAEIDLERKDMYIQSALKSTDMLIDRQLGDGCWGEVLSGSVGYPFFTAQAISALSTAYPCTANKNDYKLAIEKGLEWISNNILDNGRVKTCNEIKAGVEWWRPPSSDQSIVVRAFVHAELYVTDSDKLVEWKSNRLKLISWLDLLLDESGAVKNGEGGKIVNGADVDYITDHVYTTAFTIEAYLYSYYVDKNKDYFVKSLNIVNFISNNLYYSDKAETNGILRGAYNLKDKNWDTSSVTQNGGEEGGGNMIYSGWTNAPIACHLFDFEKLIGSYQLKINYNSSITEIPILKITDTVNSNLHISLGNKIYCIPLVDINDINASNFRLCIGNEVKSLKKI